MISDTTVVVNLDDVRDCTVFRYSSKLQTTRDTTVHRVTS